MDETKVQIGEDVLLDIGIHSDWYISSIGYDGESVDVALRRKADRNKEWWLTENSLDDFRSGFIHGYAQAKHEYESENKPQMWTCPKCGETHHIDFERCPCCGYEPNWEYEFDIFEECDYEPKIETQTVRCPKCGRTDYIREFGKDFSVTAEEAGFKYKCINCNTYIKTEPQTERSE